MGSELLLKVQKTARVLQLESIVSNPTKAIIFLHGYGQTAEDCAEPLSSLQQLGYPIYFPEGLSSFYTKGLGGNVGSSWMTKKNRLCEIRDYVEYLNQLLALLPQSIKGLHLMGFSQGVQTLFRFAEQVNSTLQISSISAIGGQFPAEWQMQIPFSLKEVPMRFFIGDNDPLIKEAQLLPYRNLLETLSIKFYQGKHELNAPLCQLLNSWIHSIDQPFLLG